MCDVVKIARLQRTKDRLSKKDSSSALLPRGTCSQKSVTTMRHLEREKARGANQKSIKVQQLGVCWAPSSSPPSPIILPLATKTGRVIES